jgi:hypothetical protein
MLQAEQGADLTLEPGDGLALVGGRGELVVQQLLDGQGWIGGVLHIGGQVDAAKGAAAQDTLDAVASLQDGAWGEWLVGPATGPTTVACRSVTVRLSASRILPRLLASRLPSFTLSLVFPTSLVGRDSHDCYNGSVAMGFAPFRRLFSVN